MNTRIKNLLTRTLVLRNRLHGVMVGLLLGHLFFCNLLARCGDVELNPGPPKTDYMRQTRLSSRDKEGSDPRRMSDHTARASHDSAVAAAANQPTLNDVMDRLTVLRQIL